MKVSIEKFGYNCHGQQGYFGSYIIELATLEEFRDYLLSLQKDGGEIRKLVTNGEGLCMSLWHHMDFAFNLRINEWVYGSPSSTCPECKKVSPNPGRCTCGTGAGEQK